MPSFKAALVVLFVAFIGVVFMKTTPANQDSEYGVDQKVVFGTPESNLIPFARPGRAQMGFPHLWAPLNFLVNDMDSRVPNMHSYEQRDQDFNEISDQKREGGLIPFPRVGRTEHASERNAGGSMSLWFGPRLGKRRMIGTFPRSEEGFNMLSNCCPPGGMVMEVDHKPEQLE